MRELENALEFAVTVCTGQTVQPEDLPPEVLAGRHAAPRAASSPPRPSARPSTGSGRADSPGPLMVSPPNHGRDGARADDGAGALRAALEAHRWNRAATAQALGLSRSTLWRRMRATGLS